MTPPPPAPLSANRFLQTMLVLYVAFWIALAIHPVDRGDWFLENLLVFTTVAVLGLTYRRFQFSNLSYLLLILFLALHAIGAHYTLTPKYPSAFGWPIGCIFIAITLIASFILVSVFSSFTRCASSWFGPQERVDAGLPVSRWPAFLP
jgi:hypothetical protein